GPGRGQRPVGALADGDDDGVTGELLEGAVGGGDGRRHKPIVGGPLRSLAVTRTSPLHERHVAAGAKLADFGGWSMPIEYAGGGVLAEHTAVRTAVGLFDVSHLGTGTVRGPGAAALVDATLTNDLGRIGPGQAQYTLCCVPDGEP